MAGYRVVVAVRPPFAFKSKDSSRTGNALWYGFLVDLIPVVLQYAGLNTTFEFYESPQNSGGDLVNGTYNGVVGELIKGRADMAAFPLTIIPGRTDVIDMTYSVYDAGLALLVKQQIVGAKNYFFLRPFTWSLWLALLATTFFVPVYSALLRKISPFGNYDVNEVRPYKGNEQPKKFVVQTAQQSDLMDTWMAVILNPVYPRSRSWAIRMFAIGYGIFCIIVAAFYTANLASYLTVQKFDTAFQSLQDLVASGQSFASNANGATQQYFDLSLDSLAQVLAPRAVYYPGPDASVAAVRAGEVAAYVVQRPVGSYYTGQLPCDLEIVGESFGPANYAFGLQKNSPLLPSLNKAILALRLNGIIDETWRKWSSGISQCSSQPAVTNNAISVHDFASLWWVLFLVGAAGLAWAVGERILVNMADRYPSVRRRVKHVRKLLKSTSHKRFALSRQFSTTMARRDSDGSTRDGGQDFEQGSSKKVEVPISLEEVVTLSITNRED